MAAPTNNYLKIPYDIGSFIASQVPYLDSNDVGEPWAQHEDQFHSGPNPFYHQMTQGMLLEVLNMNQRPRAIYTKYGEWIVLGPSNGSFDKVFNVVKKALDLKLMAELSTDKHSFYAIQSFKGTKFEEPITAKKENFISYEEAMDAYKEFKQSLSLKS